MEKKTEFDFLKQVAEQANELFFFYNVQTDKIEYINPAFEEITKRDRKDFELKSGHLLDIVHPDDREYVKITLKQFAKRKNRSLLDFRIIWPDNTERWARLKIYPVVEDDELQYVGGILEDDAARKTSIFNMQRVNSWKDSTLEIPAHDLKGPIGIVQMLSSSINDHFPGKEHKKVHEWTAIINKICKRNIDLIKSLLKNESLETEVVELSLERVDVVWEINEVINIYQKVESHISRRVEFTHSHDKIFAEIDSMKFTQIFNNLLSNAVKFTKEDGVIKIHIEKLEQTVLFPVSDNGIGIPKELQRYLFNKYTKAGREGLMGEESVGLGMWIVKSMTEMHQGKVWFETEVNKGTEFYIELPLDIQRD
ncbi:PAS domain-containing sensor histidine kinase [Pedobacter sp. SYSU D00535]|uniref:PAS domain-containing sensor histidine kinase n=1 Tax=Pedobacter sp. SYSU D00535 TaxID=2810308 RepID=UPI001A966312|nr:PAS domain-containing sensor histidine kinase [Pedobacter sp. SYSU D00535]